MILIETSRIQKKHMPLLDRMIIGLVIVVLGVNLYVINCCVNLRQELKILKQQIDTLDVNMQLLFEPEAELEIKEVQ